MAELSLFSHIPERTVDRQRTGGVGVSVDESFANTERIQLDDHCWIEHVHGWLTGEAEFMALLMRVAAWEQRQRWMFTQMVMEPRLTAEYPVISNSGLPVLTYVAEALSHRYQRTFSRLWMNWYRNNNDGTGWHADRPANQLPEAVIPVLSLGASRRFLIRPNGGGASTVLEAQSGDVIIMGGQTQRHFQHMVPKQKRVTGARLSLNFSVPIENAPLP